MPKRKNNSNKKSSKSNIYQQMLDESPFITFRINREGILTYGNKYFFDTFNLVQDNNSSINIFSIIPNDDHTIIREMIDNIYFEKKSITTIQKFYINSTIPKWQKWITKPWLNETGEVNELYIVAEDVTNQYEIENRLTSEKDFSKDIIENTPTLICRITEDGMINYVNPACARITGYNAKELLGSNWWGVLFPSLVDENLNDLLEKIKINKKQAYELELTRKDKTVRTITWNFITRVNSKDEPTEIIAFGADISEKKNAYEEIKKRFKIEKAISIISALFVGSFDLHECISFGLQIIGEHTSSSRAFILQLDKNDEIISNTFEWCASGIEEKITLLQNIPKKDIPTFWDYALAGSPFASINNTKEFPISENDFAILQLEENHYLMLVPFTINNNLVGVLGITKVPPNKNYSTDDLNILQTSAQIFGNAWQKVIFENELFIHKQHLNKAQENAKLGSWEWDFVEEKMLWSDEMVRLFSVDRNQFTGRINDWLLLPIIEPDRQIVFTLFKKILENHQPQQFEFRIKSNTGKILTLLGKCEIVYNSLRHPQKIFGTIQDITELKKIQEELKQNQEKISSIIQAVPIPIFYKDKNGIYKECNDAFSQYFGVTKDKIINHSVFDIAAYEEAQISDSVDSEILLTGENKTYEAKFKHSDQSERDLIFYKSAITNKENQIIGLVGAMLDISDRKKVENSIRESQRLITQIIDTIPLMVYAIDIDGKFIFANRKTCQFYNKNIDDLVGKRQVDLHADLTDDQQDFFINEDRNIILSQHRKYIAERIYTDYKGIQTIVEVYKIPFTIHGDKSVLTVAQDITEKKYANEALKKSEKRYRNLVENNFHLIAETNAEGNYIYINSAYTNILDYQTHDLIGKSIFEKVHPDDRENIQNKFLSEESDAVLRYQHKNGSWIWFESYGKKYISPNNEVRAVIISRDITARKLAQEKIKKSERNYREIFNATQSAIFILDETHFSIIDVNRTATNLFGYEKDEIIRLGLNALSYGKQPYSKSDFDFWTNKLKKEPQVILEWLARNKNQNLFWAEFIIQFAWINGVKRLILVARDISSRKRNDQTHKAMFNIALAVNRAEDLNEFFILLQKEISQVLLAKNMQIGLYNQKNNSITLVFQRDEKFVYNQFDNKKSFGLFVINENKPIHLNSKQIEEHIKLGKYEVFKEPPKCIMGVPLRKGGKVIGVIILQSYTEASVYNETDLSFLEFISTQVAVAIVKKQNEQEIKTLSLSVQQSPANIIITDTDGFIEYVNPKFESTTGYTLEELAGQQTSILNSGANPDEKYEELWSKISEGGEWSGELLNKKKSGELYWESMRISPIKNEIGEISHFLSVGEDITVKKEIETQLIEAKRRAEKSNQLKTEFLAQMSHEVRTPVNTIISFTNLLIDELAEKIDEDLRNGFYGITHAGKRLIRTIDLILNMAEVQSDNYELEMTEIDLYSDVLEIVYFEQLQVAKEKGLLLNLKKWSDNSLILGDPYTVNQIFINLVDNAIKYTETGKIDITLQESENYIHAIIEDTGIGMSEEFLPSLFEPFSQEDQGYTRRYEGNGLGLALVKNYCTLNNAEISVDSKKEKGTKFKISFKKNI